MILDDTKFPDADLATEDRAQTIRDRIRDAIVDRRLAPGAKLSEGEVGALFEVSRTVARAALNMLAFEGLVRIERNRGAFVANPTPDEARQVFASRRLIEAGIAAEACARVTPADIAALEAQLAAEDRLTHERGPSARRAEIRASGDFHLMLAAIAGNAILHRFMVELVARSSLVIALYGRSGASSCAHGDHRRIVEALGARDPARLEALLIRHLDHIEGDLDLQAGSSDSLRDAFGH